MPTLFIHSNGGTYSDSSSFSKIIDTGRCYFDTVQNITHSDPQKEGYRFLGYSTCENYDGEKCVFLESTEDYCHSILFSDPQNFEIHLYAVYEQFPMILLDGNGGLFQNNKGFVYKIIDTRNKYWYLNP
ncbi:hypothetical protein IJM86_07620 [bacterium]|nr:hypothetical protein [bacterium]